MFGKQLASFFRNRISLIVLAVVALSGGILWSVFAARTKRLTIPTGLRRKYDFIYKTTMRDGLPFMKVRLANHPPIVAVADTGSTYLNVAHHGCRQCARHDGVYHGDINPDHKYGVEYGSQKDVVSPVVHELVLCPNDRKVKVPLFTTVKRTNFQSNLNIFGLLRRPNGVLAHAMNPNSSLLVTFRDNDTGFVAGISNQEIDKISIPLHVTPLVKTSRLPYFVVEVVDMTMGDYSFRRQPKYLVIDTGSNMTSFAPRLFDELMDQMDESSQPLQFQLKSGGSLPLKCPTTSGPPILSIAQSRLYWKNSASLMIDDDLGILASQSQVAILGAYALQNKTFIFQNRSMVFG